MLVRAIHLSTSARLLACLALIAAAFVSCGKPAGPGVVHLVFWHAWTGYEGKFLESLVDEFNRTHPSIQVKPSSFVIGDKLMAAIAGGIPPDVATVWDWMLPTMGESGCLIPLNDYLARSGIGPNDYLPRIWEYGMFSGVKYGVPTSLNLTMIYFNKAIFREAGLDPGQPPRTIDELASCSYALSQYDNDGRLTRIGYMPGSPFVWFWNSGGEIYDPASRRFTVDSPENLRALEWMTSFYRKYGMDKYRRFTATFGEYQSPNNPFYTGRIAVREEGQWQISFIQQFAPNMDYGVFPFPSAVPGQPSLTLVAGSFWAIPVGCSHPDEAWTFLSWLIAPEQSARFAAALYNVPPMRKALAGETFRPLLATPMKDFVSLLEEGRARFVPTLPIGQVLTNEFNAVTENVFAGDLTPAEGLKVLNARLQKALDKALRHLGRDEPKP